jgi:hypothetical protein
VDDLGESVCVWSLADIEVRSAQTVCVIVKKKGVVLLKQLQLQKKVISVNHLHYKTPEKTRATEELVGYSLSYKLQYFFGVF